MQSRATIRYLVVLAGGLAACVSTPPPAPAPPPELRAAPSERRPLLEERWGIEIVGIHLTAAGHMVDFRYRVLDPGKAAPLLDRRNVPQLIDQETGATLTVPHAPKVGSLRQNTLAPKAGRVAFALFGNPQRMVKPGSKVTVRIGDFEAENLTVQ